MTWLARGPRLAVLFAGVLLAALDIAIVGPALPAIRDTFAVDSRAGCRPCSASTCCSTCIGTPLLAKALRSCGRRRVFRRKPRRVRRRVAGRGGGVVAASAAARPRGPSVRRRRHFAGRGRRHRRNRADRAARPDARAHRRRVRRGVLARPAARRVAAALGMAMAVPHQRARGARADGGRQQACCRRSWRNEARRLRCARAPSCCRRARGARSRHRPARHERAARKPAVAPRLAVLRVARARRAAACGPSRSAPRIRCCRPTLLRSPQLRVIGAIAVAVGPSRPGWCSCPTWPCSVSASTPRRRA